MSKLQVHQDEFGQSLFDLLPNELVCKIMIDMSLKDRQHLVDAYPIPRFLKLAQSPVLKTRVLTRSDIFTERQDLEKVLDPEGIEIQVDSLHHRHSVSFVNLSCSHYDEMLNLNVFHLMPNLTQVILKKCVLRALRYCQEKRLCTFFDCELQKMLLAKVRYLEFDDCYHDKESRDMTLNRFSLWSWRDFIHIVFLHSDSSIMLREVTMRNSLTLRDFKKLIRDIVIWILTSTCSSRLNRSDFRIEMKNHERESIDIAPIIFSSVETLYPTLRLDLCLEAFRTTMRWPEYSVEDESIKIKCKMFEMRKDGRGVLKTMLTEDFDMAVLRRELVTRLGAAYLHLIVN